MKSPKVIIIDFLMFIVGLSLYPAIKRNLKIIKLTPKHCGETMEFVGENQSLIEHTIFYQCPVCKLVQQVNYNQ
jgi:hypothetical protein